MGPEIIEGTTSPSRTRIQRADTHIHEPLQLLPRGLYPADPHAESIASVQSLSRYYAVAMQENFEFEPEIRENARIRLCNLCRDMRRHR